MESHCSSELAHRAALHRWTQVCPLPQERVCSEGRPTKLTSTSISSFTVWKQTPSCLFLYLALSVHCPSQTPCEIAKLVKPFLCGVVKIVWHVMRHPICCFEQCLKRPPIRIFLMIFKDTDSFPVDQSILNHNTIQQQLCQQLVETFLNFCCLPQIDLFPHSPHSRWNTHWWRNNRLRGLILRGQNNDSLISPHTWSPNSLTHSATNGFVGLARLSQKSVTIPSLVILHESALDPDPMWQTI